MRRRSFASLDTPALGPITVNKSYISIPKALVLLSLVIIYEVSHILLSTSRWARSKKSRWVFFVFFSSPSSSEPGARVLIEKNRHVCFDWEWHHTSDRGTQSAMTHVRAQHGISGNVNGGGGFLFFDARITSASIPEPWSYILFRQNNNANRDNKKQPTNNLYTNATQYYSTCIYTHTLSVKATAAAVIVCVKPAAY